MSKKKRLTKDSYDFVIMSHLTQHFSESEFANSLKSLNTIIKNNGILVFDLLIRESDK